MSTVPKGRRDGIAFYESRVATWVANAGEIGADPAVVAQLAELTAAARQASRDQQMAQQAARAATIRLNLAIADMRRVGSSILKMIDASATSTHNPRVYSLASISPPAKPSPIGAPGKPHSFDVELDPIGAVTLKWKCDNPKDAEGTVYHVYRQIVGQDERFVILGYVGEKKFRDDTLPPGGGAGGRGFVQYQVQAVRSTKSGPAAIHNVYFGAGRSSRLGPQIGAGAGAGESARVVLGSR